MALARLIYSVFPRAGASVLARVHFWLINLAASEIVAALGLLVFAVNLFVNLKR